MLATMRQKPPSQRLVLGRPLHPNHVVSLVTALDGNIQDPIARWPSRKRANFRYGPRRKRYAVFNLDRRFRRAAAETSSHFVWGPGRVSHRPFEPVRVHGLRKDPSIFRCWRRTETPGQIHLDQGLPNRAAPSNTLRRGLLRFQLGRSPFAMPTRVSALCTHSGTQASTTAAGIRLGRNVR
jgi:hypothetical protein